MVNLQEFSDVTVTVEDGQVQVDRSSDHKDQRAKHGLYRSLINNMVVGVTEGFTKSLELVELVIELLIKDKK
jgi:large subunit ribosomal protein L6